jgi:quercetin dioxygenase-like cupin family protein
MSTLRIAGPVLVLSMSACFVQRVGAADPAPVVSPIMHKDVDDVAGREMLMITVVYPPGAVEQIHRHDANAFVYVLEGTIIEGVKGGVVCLLYAN